MNARRLFLIALAATLFQPLWLDRAHGAPLAPAEVRAIAKEAYIYGFPMVDNMRIQYDYFVDRNSPQFKASWNNLFNIPRVFTPDDKAIQTPNSDTPYSWIGLDLRTEPIVFTVPPIPKERYWSLQLIDLYTQNFAYLGTRTTGNDGGSFMIVGPNWKGATPKGITKVIHCETEIASAQFRTQLFNADDLENVKQIQNQYVVRPLSRIPWRAPAEICTPDQFPQAPHARGREDFARFLLPNEFRVAVRAAHSIRKSAAGPICQNWCGVGQAV